MHKLNTIVFLLTMLGTMCLQAQTARVQVIHNSPDALAAIVDVYLDDALLIDDFVFRTASPFIDAPAGVDFTVGIAPANSSSSADAIATFDYNLAANETYIIVASGIVNPAGYNPAPAFNLEVFAGAREAATINGNTDVLVYHGSTDAPTVDVVETAITSGATIVDNASYSDFAGYLELQTLDYRLEVRDETGTVTVKSYEAPLNTLGLQNAALTVLASGFLDPSQNSNGASFGLFVALPSGGALIPLPESTARVQVIHNSPDPAAAVVDVYLNDALLLDNFAFRTATPFVDVPAGTDFTIGVAPPTSVSVDDIIASFDYNLSAGGTYMIIADGLVIPFGFDPFVGFSLEVYPLAREQASIAGNTDVLVHHGSTDAPTVDVVETLVTNNATIVDDLAYGQFAGYLELPSADYRIEVRDQTGVVTVASYDAPLATLQLTDAALAVFASGFLNPANNSNGPAFGLYVALPQGGELIPLPLSIPSATKDLERIPAIAYPNPATDFVNLELPDRMVESVRLLDMAGKQVSVSSQIKDGMATFNTSTLHAGMYILEVTGEDFTSSARITIQR